MVDFAPSWFLGVDVEFQLLFTLITFGIALYAHRLAKVVKDKNYFVFSAGFLLISAGYAVRTLFNFLIYFNLLSPDNAMGPDWVHFAGFYLSSILFLGGLVLLLSNVFKVRDIRPTIMLYLTTIIAFILSANRQVLLFVLSVVFLAMIIYHHAKNFWITGNSTAFIVLFGFVLILIGQLNFLFRLSQTFYVLGHVAELLGYLSLLAAIIKIVRK